MNIGHGEPKRNRVDRTPTHNDLAITNLVHLALATVQDAGRFGDRKVFIASLWTMMLRIEAQTGGTLTDGATLEHFKAWLLRGRRVTRDGTEEGAPLVVLARADFVAAMDHTVVAASETVMDGATFHFVLDPAVACSEYARRTQAPKAVVPATSETVGRIGTSRRPDTPRSPDAAAQVGSCRRFGPRRFGSRSVNVQPLVDADAGPGGIDRVQRLVGPASR